MSTALYQKYRPQTFADVVDQNHIKITLQNSIIQGKVGHAYLFYGPRAVGKTTTARLLAKAVNCENRKENESEPCNTCPSCLEITSGRSLDIVEIDAASHTGVDNVRENIIANVRVATSKRKFKVFIIDEVHMLSISAFNALLKTLEEPPKNVIFILATTEIHKVPATIISRCQRFDFKRISNLSMFKRLQFLVKEEGKQLDDEVLNDIVRQVGGYARDAESLLGQVLSMDEKIITRDQASIIIAPSNFNLVAEFVEYLADKNIAGAIGYINKLVNESVDLNNFSKDLIDFLRKLLFVKISDNLDPFTVELNSEITEKLLKIKEKSDVQYLTKAINIFLSRVKELAGAHIRQLPLEIAVMELMDDGGGQVVLQQQAESKVVINEENLKNISFIKNSDEKNTVIGNGLKNNTSPGWSVNVSLEQIQEKWPQVLDHVKKNEASMSFMLGAAKPQNLSGNTLQIAFKHKFHCESMQNNSKAEKMEKILENIFNEKIKIKCYTDLTIEIDPVKVAPVIQESDDLQNIDQQSDGELKGLLDMFGGKVVG